MKSELIEIVRNLKSYDLYMKKYLDRIPTDIRSIVFDNEYTGYLSSQTSMLIEQLFDEYTEDIMWFLYEFKVGSAGPHIVDPDGTEYTFYTDEDYYHYLESLGEFDNSQRPWVGLTDDEAWEWFKNNTVLTRDAALRITKAIETKLIEKNNVHNTKST